MTLLQYLKTFLQGSWCTRTKSSVQLKASRYLTGNEQAQSQQDNTYQQDRRHCCFEQIEFRLGKILLHYKQLDRYFLRSKILQGK